MSKTSYNDTGTQKKCGEAKIFLRMQGGVSNKITIHSRRNMLAHTYTIFVNRLCINFVRILELWPLLRKNVITSHHYSIIQYINCRQHFYQLLLCLEIVNNRVILDFHHHIILVFLH